MRRIATNLLSLLLMLPGAAWCDIGTTTIDDSAHAAPMPAAARTRRGASGTGGTG